MCIKDCAMSENKEIKKAALISEITRREIESLPVAYAYATDCLGHAVETMGDQSLESTFNMDNSFFAEGLSLYRKIFSKEFSFELVVEGRQIEVVPDPKNLKETEDAVLVWTNYVNNAFRKGLYKSTQHHIGSINSSIEGNNNAIVQSYLIATHVYSEVAPDTGVSMTWGTYTDEVILEEESWVIKNRRLDVISTNPISAVAKLAVE